MGHTVGPLNTRVHFSHCLCQLAGDVRAVLRPGTKITYGADWSEYFGYRPEGSAGWWPRGRGLASV